MSYPFDVKESIEHKGYCTGAQGLMLLYDLKTNYCDPSARLATKALPPTLKLLDRQRSVDIKAVMDIDPMIDAARVTLRKELQERAFDRRPSNARMVQLYMSKQMDVKAMLTTAQYELAKTLYLQWMRDANKIVKLASRSSPRKAQKTSSSGGLFRGASMVDWMESPDSPSPEGGFDPVMEEIDRWNHLSSDVWASFIDGDGLLNEFEMMWSLRERFPLHLVVFKRTACHLPHEANVEQVFSRAGNLSDPNMDPEYLALLTIIAVNQKSFWPTLEAIKLKYYEMFRGKGGEGIDEESGGSSSNDGARPMQGDEALDNLSAHPQWQA